MIEFIVIWNAHPYFRQKAPLSQRDRATRYVSKFVLWKVLNIKSHYQGHSRALAMMPFDRPCTYNFLLLFHCSRYLAPFPRCCHLFPKM